MNNIIVGYGSTSPPPLNNLFQNAAGSITNLYDVTGTVTGVGLSPTAAGGGTNSIGAGNHDGSGAAAWVLAWMNAEAGYLPTGPTSYNEYTWTGLTPGAYYHVETYGIASSGTGELHSTVNGSDELYHLVNNNLTLTNFHAAVAADGSGNVKFQAWQLNGSAYLAAIRLVPVTGPVLSSPTGTATGSSTATGTVSTDTGTGTLYYLASANATETASTIKTTGASQAVSATGSQSVSVSGLTASTAYYLHYYQEDASSNPSNVADSSSFTTSAATSAPSISDIVINAATGTLSGSALSGTSPTIAIAAGGVTVNQANVVASGTTASFDYTTDNGTTQLPLYSTSANVLFTSSSGNASITTSLPTASGYSVIVAGTSFDASQQSAWGYKTSPATGDQASIPLVSDAGAAVSAANYGTITLTYTDGSGNHILPPVQTDQITGVTYWDMATGTRSSPVNISVYNQSYVPPGSRRLHGLVPSFFDATPISLVDGPF